MALRAGRVGVRPDQVDTQGKVISGGGETAVKFYLDVFSFTPSSNPSTTKSAGWSFRTLGGLKVDGVKIFSRETSAKVYLSTDATHHIYSATLTDLTAGEWNTIMFDEPIELEANKTYVLWYSGTGDTNNLKYKSGLTTSMFLTNVQCLTNSASDTFPSSTESNSYGVDMITHLLQ